MRWEDLNKELRERIIREHPGQFNQAGIVVTVKGQKLQPDPVRPLAQFQRERKTRCARLVIVVTFISCRRKLLDDDNLPSAFKGLRDAVAGSIGLDDGDKRFRWEYRQIETAGEEGTIVTVEVIG